MRTNRFNQDSLEEFQADPNSEGYNYELAVRRVKKIKGFYIHLIVFVFINLFIIGANTNVFVRGNGEFWRFETFSTAFFWGIGLLAHGLNVFGKNIFFGKDWEEKKIQQYMKKEKSSHWE